MPVNQAMCLSLHLPHQPILVPRLACIGRSFLVVSFLLCVYICGNQSLIDLESYLRYPGQVQHLQQRMTPIRFPALSICVEKGYNLTALCEAFPYMDCEDRDGVRRNFIIPRALLYFFCDLRKIRFMPSRSNGLSVLIWKKPRRCSGSPTPEIELFSIVVSFLKTLFAHRLTVTKRRYQSHNAKTVFFLESHETSQLLLSACDILHPWNLCSWEPSFTRYIDNVCWTFDVYEVGNKPDHPLADCPTPWKYCGYSHTAQILWIPHCWAD